MYLFRDPLDSSNCLNRLLSWLWGLSLTMAGWLPCSQPVVRQPHIWGSGPRVLCCVGHPFNGGTPSYKSSSQRSIQPKVSHCYCHQGHKSICPKIFVHKCPHLTISPSHHLTISPSGQYTSISSAFHVHSSLKVIVNYLKRHSCQKYCCNYSRNICPWPSL